MSHPTPGAAYIFERGGTVWLQRGKLIADDGKAGDLLGNAVAISGETILVGAPGVDDAGPEAGAAYVFVRAGDEWIQQAKLIGADSLKCLIGSGQVLRYMRIQR